MLDFAKDSPYLFTLIILSILSTLYYLGVSFINRNKPNNICPDDEKDIET